MRHVAALVTAITVGLLVGAAAAAVAQDEEAAELETPLYYTWTAGDPASEIEGVVDEETGELRGLVREGVPVEASDPRMSGLAYFSINASTEADATGQLESRSYRFVSEGGTWTGSGMYVVAEDPSAGGSPVISREAMLLTGEGVYEGLVMFITGDYRKGASGEGVILRVAVPPVPDVPDAPAE